MPNKNGIRLTIQAFGDLDDATLANMTLELTIGDDTIVGNSDWLQMSWGWKNLHH